MKQKTIEQILSDFYHHINMNYDKEYQNKHKKINYHGKATNRN